MMRYGRRFVESVRCQIGVDLLHEQRLANLIVRTKYADGFDEGLWVEAGYFT